MAKLVPVCTILIAVVCSMAMQETVYKIDNFPMQHDEASTHIYMIDSIFMQHEEASMYKIDRSCMHHD